MKFRNKKNLLILPLLVLSIVACERRTQELVDDQQEKANATPLPPDDLPPEEEVPESNEVGADTNLPPAAISCQLSFANNQKTIESCIGTTSTVSETESKYSTIDSADLSEQIHARIEMSYRSDSTTEMYAIYKVQFYHKNFQQLSLLGLFRQYEVNLLNQDSMSLSGIILENNQEYILNCKVRSLCSH